MCMFETTIKLKSTLDPDVTAHKLLQTALACVQKETG